MLYMCMHMLHTHMYNMLHMCYRRSGLALHPPEGYYTSTHGLAAPDWRGGIRVGRTMSSTQ